MALELGRYLLPVQSYGCSNFGVRVPSLSGGPDILQNIDFLYFVTYFSRLVREDNVKNL